MDAGTAINVTSPFSLSFYCRHKTDAAVVKAEIQRVLEKADLPGEVVVHLSFPSWLESHDANNVLARGREVIFAGRRFDAQVLRNWLAMHQMTDDATKTPVGVEVADSGRTPKPFRTNAVDELRATVMKGDEIPSEEGWVWRGNAIIVGLLIYWALGMGLAKLTHHPGALTFIMLVLLVTCMATKRSGWNWGVRILWIVGCWLLSPILTLVMLALFSGNIQEVTGQFLGSLPLAIWGMSSSTLFTNEKVTK